MRCEWLRYRLLGSQWGSGMQTRLPYWFLAFVPSLRRCVRCFDALGESLVTLGPRRRERPLRHSSHRTRSDGAGSVEFTPEELEKWGERLSAGTPRILKMLEEERPRKRWPLRWNGTESPRRICLRFIIALGQHSKPRPYARINSQRPFTIFARWSPVDSEPG